MFIRLYGVGIDESPPPYDLRISLLSVSLVAKDLGAPIDYIGASTISSLSVSGCPNEL